MVTPSIFDMPSIFLTDKNNNFEFMVVEPGLTIKVCFCFQMRFGHQLSFYPTGCPKKVSLMPPSIHRLRLPCGSALYNESQESNSSWTVRARQWKVMLGVSSPGFLCMEYVRGCGCFDVRPMDHTGMRLDIQGWKTSGNQQDLEIRVAAPIPRYFHGDLELQFGVSFQFWQNIEDRYIYISKVHGMVNMGVSMAMGVPLWMEVL